NEGIVVRGRTQAGNLAHGLKTPLSILANEVDRLAADGASQLSAAMRGQIETMRQQIDYHLARARAAASLDVPGARVPVAPSVAASHRDGGCLTIAIEDDGPGLPEEQQAYAPAPGARFDEKVPGNGLGLAIVRDLATLYNGSIKLGSSSLGGLRAELTLPAG